MKPLDRREKICLHAREQHRDAVRFGLAQEMLEALEADHVGIAHALEPQNDVMRILRRRAFQHGVEIAFEFGRCAEEQLAFKIDQDQPGVRRIAREPFAHDALRADDELLAL